MASPGLDDEGGRADIVFVIAAATCLLRTP